MDELSISGEKATDPYPLGGFYCPDTSFNRKSHGRMPSLHSQQRLGTSRAVSWHDTDSNDCLGALTISRAVPSTRWPMTYQVLSNILTDLYTGSLGFGASMPAAMDISLTLHPGNVRVGIGLWVSAPFSGHQAGNMTSSPNANSAAGSVDVA